MGLVARHSTNLAYMHRTTINLFAFEKHLSACVMGFNCEFPMFLIFSNEKSFIFTNFLIVVEEFLHFRWNVFLGTVHLCPHGCWKFHKFDVLLCWTVLISQSKTLKHFLSVCACGKDNNCSLDTINNAPHFFHN